MSQDSKQRFKGSLLGLIFRIEGDIHLLVQKEGSDHPEAMYGKGLKDDFFRSLEQWLSLHDWFTNLSELWAPQVDAMVEGANDYYKGMGSLELIVGERGRWKPRFVVAYTLAMAALSMTPPEVRGTLNPDGTIDTIWLV